MSRFQFILVWVAALFVVGCVLVPPTSAVSVEFESCTDISTLQTLNITGVDVRPYPTPNFQLVNITARARTDHEIRGGLFVVLTTTFPPAAGSDNLCDVSSPPCPIAAGDFIIRTSFIALDAFNFGFQTVRLLILNEEGRYGPCVFFDIPVLEPNDPMLKLAAN